ncbi:DUF3237 family protein [Kocuria sp. CPCC 205297]|uniref:DUF3237 family protein n=1 Tax=Kocuria sp. CPCC 205297 TaxID=3073558 RepID=UPI0034D442DD
MRARPAGVLGPRVEAGRTPQSPVLRHAFTVRVEVAAPLTVGRTAVGTCRVAPITGGAVTGPHGSGRVLPAGADDQVVGTKAPGSRPSTFWKSPTVTRSTWTTAPCG